MRVAIMTPLSEKQSVSAFICSGLMKGSSPWMFIITVPASALPPVIILAASAQRSVPLW